MEGNSEDRCLSASGTWHSLRKDMEFRYNSGEMGLVESLFIAWNYQMEDFNIN